MLPVAAVGFLAALAMSGGAAHSLESSKESLSRPQRVALSVLSIPFEALIEAPIEQILGVNTKSGKFGGTNVFTGTAPQFLTNALETFRTTLLSNNHGTDGIGFPNTSSLTLNTNGLKDSSKAFKFLSEWLLLTLSGGANLIRITTPAQQKEEINKITRMVTGIADFFRWNLDTLIANPAFQSVTARG
jgi:hypothetical protein